jgi:hypothetical protein
VGVNCSIKSSRSFLEPVLEEAAKLKEPQTKERNFAFV